MNCLNVCERLSLRAHVAVLVLLAISVRPTLAASPGYQFRILVQTGDTIGGKTLTGISSPVLNDSGAVAFYGTFSDGTGIFTPIELLARSGYFDANGNFIGEIIDGKLVLRIGFLRPDVAYTEPAINNPGTVLFEASFQVPNTATGPGQAQGLFTSSELLLTAGDTITGKTVASNPYSFPASFGHYAINDSGAIVFETTFTDGSYGIVLATPISSGVAGDVNGDGVVDCTDLAIIKTLFGRTFGQAGFDPRADTNGDGVIDVRDLAFVAQHLPAGASCH
jgi:hypothetical protein